MALEFTEVTEEHAAELLQIYNHYVLNSTATFHEHPLSLGEMRQILFFENPRYRSFVIRERQKVLGYCLVSRFHEREAYRGTGTVSIYLKAGESGQGYGSAALDFLEEYARQQQFHVLMAIITGENTDSIRLFARRGYCQCGHLKEVGRKFGRLLDVVYYQKIIENSLP